MNSAALPMNPVVSLWQNLHSRLLFKFVLPQLQSVELEGVKLDVSGLSSLMKNHIRTGRYEVQERRIAQRVLTKNDVVLELGGAIGFIGLFCRQQIGVKHHFSVEANPNTLKLLQRNYALNGLKPDAIHAAAAAENGEITLDIGGEFWENSVLKTDRTATTITVPALSLKSLVALMPESPTTLICDIEGAEQYLDFSQLPASVTKIIIELHPEMTGQQTVNEIVAGLEALGFKTMVETDGTWFLAR